MLFHRGVDGVKRDRLGDDANGADLALHKGRLWDRSQQNNRCLRDDRIRIATQALCEGDTVHHGHHHVQEDEAGCLVTDAIQRIQTVDSRTHLIPFALQKQFDHFPRIVVIFHYEDGIGRSRHGMSELIHNSAR